MDVELAEILLDCALSPGERAERDGAVFQDPGRGRRVENTWYFHAKLGIAKWTGKQFYCEHNRAPAACAVCGGGSVCSHRRRRSMCRECGTGVIFCKHQKHRSVCELCGGGGLCAHNRPRTRCRTCGGGSFCQHGRVRAQCALCSLSILLEGVVAVESSPSSQELKF